MEQRVVLARWELFVASLAVVDPTQAEELTRDPPAFIQRLQHQVVPAYRSNPHRSGV